jgi:hypothetical protein
MSKKISYSIIIILILAILGGFAYFFFYANKPAPQGNTGGSNVNVQNPFSPFSSSGTTNNQGSSDNSGTNSTSTVVNGGQIYQYPKVREIWPTPIGGFVASTTASSTFVRFVDRGTGYIYDMNTASATPANISNTTVPLVYESYWNKNAMSGIFRYIKEGGDDITNFYVQLKSTATTTNNQKPKTNNQNGSNASSTATSTATTSIPTIPIISQTPYQLRGTYFPGNIISVAVSPKGNQIFTVELVGGNGAGFISNIDGSGSKQIFSTPLAQVNAFWPTTNTLMLATRASAGSLGYLYSINTKTGVMSEVFGGVGGLSVLPNGTAQLVLYSDLSSSGNLVTSLYNIKNASSQDLPFTTLAEKCVWSRQNPLNLYCAVPSSAPTTGYPDAWYEGTASGVDQIIELDTDTGSVHLVSNLAQDARTQIDAEWLALDPTEHFLYFVNKRDLSLWSVDLNQN